MKNISLLIISVVLLGCHRDQQVADSSPVKNGTVTIEIVGSSGTESIEIPAVAAGTTLETVMRRVEQVPVQIQGTGSTAFVNKIGDLATDSRQGWTYKIDGQHINRGLGSTTLSPPTTVTWRYGEF
jgi:hypothetical protein